MDHYRVIITCKINNIVLNSSRLQIEESISLTNFLNLVFDIIKKKGDYKIVRKCMLDQQINYEIDIDEDENFLFEDKQIFVFYLEVSKLLFKKFLIKY